MLSSELFWQINKVIPYESSINALILPLIMGYQRLICTRWKFQMNCVTWIFWPLHTALLSCQTATHPRNASFPDKLTIWHMWIICPKTTSQCYLTNILYPYAKMWLLNYFSLCFKVHETIFIKDEKFMAKTQHIYWMYILFKAYGGLILQNSVIFLELFSKDSY